MAVIGESTGQDSGANMVHDFTLIKACGLIGLQWAFDYQLYDGTYATIAQFAAQIHTADLSAPTTPPYGKGFSPLPGAASAISVGANGSAWVVGTNAVAGGYGIYQLGQTGSWVKYPGGAVEIAVGPDGSPWLVKLGSRTSTTGPGTSFSLVPGAASAIGVGANGSVWVVGTNAVAGGYGIYQLGQTGSWVKYPGGAVEIAVGPDGSPWVLNSAYDIYHWTGHGFSRCPERPAPSASGPTGLSGLSEPTRWRVVTDFMSGSAAAAGSTTRAGRSASPPARTATPG